MLNRWCNEVNCINLALSTAKRLIQKIETKKKGRGRKPKRGIAEYTLLIVLKEFDKRNLREAEAHLSRLVCKERVDHSVIAYWENKPEMAVIVQKLISIAGAMLQKHLSTIFTFVDSTKFTNWTIDEINTTVCNIIANGTVYPIGMSFRKGSVKLPVSEAVPNGTGKLYADAGYDDNDTIHTLFDKGYIPIICPNKGRYHGHYRRKARKLYRMPENRLGYRQRGRGESLFGSLTNQFGDRFTAINLYAMQTRIASRVFSYQIKILIRCQLKILCEFLDTLPIKSILYSPYLFNSSNGFNFSDVV
jgi:hypothetical protein